MSFRPFNSNFWHIAVAGWVCLGFAGAARAGDGARSIEVVPFHNTPLSTNFDSLPKDDSQSFTVWKPTAPNSVTQTAPPIKLAPLPHPQQTLTKEEQQLLDRRRNWVFMQPEDYATTDPKTGKSLLGGDNGADDNMTAMERFYHRLEQSGKSTATNDFSRLNPDRSASATNYFGSIVPNTDTGPFGATPFDSKPQTGVFQPITAGESATVFGNNNGVPLQSPEEARVQSEQKARMETFKQLWNIDQASSAATPAPAPASTPIDSAPLFGTSTPGIAPAFKPAIPPSAIPGANPSKPFTPTPQPVAPPKIITPPHSDFMPQQRPF